MRFNGRTDLYHLDVRRGRFSQTTVRELGFNTHQFPPGWTDLHKKGPGRYVVYNPEWDLKAIMLRQLEQIQYVKDLVKAPQM